MIRITLMCDYCGARVGDEKNNKMALFLIRSRMAKEGWRHDDHGGKDYCPKCAKLMADAKKVKPE